VRYILSVIKTKLRCFLLVFCAAYVATPALAASYKYFRIGIAAFDARDHMRSAITAYAAKTKKTGHSHEQSEPVSRSLEIGVICQASRDMSSASPASFNVKGPEGI